MIADIRTYINKGSARMKVFRYNFELVRFIELTFKMFFLYSVSFICYEKINVAPTYCCRYDRAVNFLRGAEGILIGVYWRFLRVKRRDICHKACVSPGRVMRSLGANA